MAAARVRKWEYALVEYSSAELNRMGSEGWEIAEFVPETESTWERFVMKREIQND